MENTGQAATGTPEATVAETQAQGTGASSTAQPTSGALKEAAQEAIRKHKLKVDGQEIEVDEEELKRGYTHQKAANKKLQEGLKAKRQAEEFIQMMKDKGSLFEAIKKLGHDPRKLAEEYLAAQLEDEMLDPREKELKEYKKKLQAYEEMEKRTKEAKEQAAREAMKKKFSEDYSKQFVEALKTEKLPPTKAMVAEMAKYIKRAADLEFEMTAQEAAKLVKEDLEMSYRNLYSEADPETLVRLLGEPGLQKVRTFDTSRIKDPNASLRTPENQGDRTPRKREPTKRMTPQEWREFNRK